MNDMVGIHVENMGHLADAMRDCDEALQTNVGTAKSALEGWAAPEEPGWVEVNWSEVQTCINRVMHEFHPTVKHYKNQAEFIADQPVLTAPGGSAPDRTWVDVPESEVTAGPVDYRGRQAGDEMREAVESGDPDAVAIAANEVAEHQDDPEWLQSYYEALGDAVLEIPGMVEDQGWPQAMVTDIVRPHANGLMRVSEHYGTGGLPQSIRDRLTVDINPSYDGPFSDPPEADPFTTTVEVNGQWYTRTMDGAETANANLGLWNDLLGYGTVEGSPLQVDVGEMALDYGQQLHDGVRQGWGIASAGGGVMEVTAHS
ncbi:MAG: hypothetical protein GEU93_09270 [Propionibacteriales bacterium]|nr:hypothetical protein [Propionibacteriales bacterium]